MVSTAFDRPHTSMTVLGSICLALAGCGGGDIESSTTAYPTSAVEVGPSTSATVTDELSTAQRVSTMSDGAAPALRPSIVYNSLAGEATTETAVEPAPDMTAAGISSARRAPRLSALDQLVAQANFVQPPRMAVEDWAQARELVKNDDGWRHWLQSRQDIVRDWFAKPRDRADLQAGYPNDYVDTQTGSALSWTPETAEPRDTKTGAESRVKGAWVAINRQYNISRALDAARLYKLTGDAAWAEIAAKQLDFYATNYLKWPLLNAIGQSRMLGQSLDEAVSVMELVETANLVRGAVTPERRAFWADQLFRPVAANLQTYAYGPLNNINLWCAAGVTAIGLHLADSELTQKGLTGPKGIFAVINSGFSTDGLWFEGSFAYNNYVLLGLSRLFDLASAHGRQDVLNALAPQTRRLLVTPALFRFDDGTLPTPSDARNQVLPVDTPTHLALYRHLPTSFGIKAAQGVRTWATLLDRSLLAGQATPEAQLPAQQSLLAEGTRMALLRRDDWQLFVHFGQRTVNHAQEEALTYELAHGKTNISRDAGTVASYGSALHTNYFSRGVGNNVPLIDGQGQQQWAPGVVNLFDAANGVLDVSHPTYRDKVQVRRTYQLHADGFSETTRITTTDASSRRLGVMFNTACTLKGVDTRAGVAAASTAPAGSPGFAFLTNVTRSQAQAEWTARWTCDNRPYTMTISGPAGHLVYRATAPATPSPSTRRALYVEATGRDAVFTTRIRAGE